MEDPTISVILSSLQSVYHLAESGIDAGENVEDILKQSWFQEKERKLKADIGKARLKSKPLSYFMMTVNMHGESHGEGTAGNRRQLLKILLGNFGSSVIFSQEQNGRDEELIIRHCQLEGRRNGTQAAVFWNGEDFEGNDEGLTSTDREVIRIRDEVKGQFGDVDVSEVLSRIVMVKLKAKHQQENANRCFLAVSWHGPRNMPVSQRRRVLLGLQEFLKKVSAKEGNIPFVIGGDFNLNTLDNEETLLENVAVSSYPPSPRNSSRSPNFIPHKDNFVYYGGIQVSWARPIDFTSRGEETRAANDLPRDEQDAVEDIPVDASRGTVDQLLDHDPILAVLELSFPVRRNLEEEFENLQTRE